MRHVVQPGTPLPERIQWVEARGRAFSFVLEAGVPLLEAARRGFAREGFSGGTLNITGGMLEPLAYVMPALSKTDEHAAYYSDTFRPAGVAQLQTAAMTFGQRDGVAFFHCHGVWSQADGRAGGGHILPEETYVAAPFKVEAFGLDGAVFTAEPDPETNFKVFGPLTTQQHTAIANTRRAFALRLRPNQDFATTLETFCGERGVSAAKLHGGVGSIIGARFADGHIVEPFATEMAVRSGRIISRAGALESELDVVLVDHEGGLARGRLTRGDNPVLMTMELVLEVFDVPE
jgi:predicted DNA-binding protein with PD1-like motif